MRFGVCWYPEQWPRRDWADDVRRMADLGLQLVRMGEFAWSTLEPARGDQRFEWLDDAIGLVRDAGMRVVLCTPTATPPLWLMRDRPEVRLVGIDGGPRQYGSRRHTCPTSLAYREESVRIVQSLADRYAGEVTIDAWQVDNEPGNHDSARCWCTACQDAFRVWLHEEFAGDIHALNAAWGQAFWSMTYPDFDAIQIPIPTMTAHNPSLEVAHRRFASRQVVTGLAAQRDVIRAADPDATTFTNLYMGDVDINGQAVHRLHGLGAIDTYPHGLDDPQQMAFNLALARGASLPCDSGVESLGGRAWVIEQQPGPVNWTGDNPAVRPGDVASWIVTAAEIGIDTLLMFRWRMARAGQEQHHAALIAHDRADTDAVSEVRSAMQTIAVRAIGSRGPATAAVVMDYEDAWMLQVMPQTEGADHRSLVTAAHTALRELGHEVDVVPADADLTGYQVVCLPGFHVTDDDRLARLQAALTAGVDIALGPRSLVRDRWAVWSEASLPAGLASNLGVRVAQAGNPRGWPRVPGEQVSVRIGEALVEAGDWVDVLEPLADAVGLQVSSPSPDALRIIGTVADGPLAQRVMAVRRGRLSYVGASSAAAWRAALLQMDLVPR